MAEQPEKENILLVVGLVCYGLGIMCGFYFGAIYAGSRGRQLLMDSVAFDVCNEIEVRTQYDECLRNVRDRYDHYERNKPKNNYMNRPSDPLTPRRGERKDTSYKGVVP